MGAIAETPRKPEPYRFDRATHRGLKRARRLRPLGDPHRTPLWPWVREGISWAYLTALLLAERERCKATGEHPCWRERKWVDAEHPAEPDPVQTRFDIEQFRTIADELQLLCRLAASKQNRKRTGGTIVTTSFQLTTMMRKCHPSWQSSGNEDDDRDRWWPVIRRRLLLMQACGLLTVRVDTDDEGYDRRTVITLHDLPPVSDEQLQAATKVLDDRRRRYGARLRGDSTRAVADVRVHSRPLTASEIKHAGVIHTRRRAAAIAAKNGPAADATQTPAVIGFATDNRHPYGTPPTENNNYLERSVKDGTNTYAREQAHALFDALNASCRPSAGEPAAARATARRLTPENSAGEGEGSVQNVAGRRQEDAGRHAIDVDSICLTPRQAAAYEARLREWLAGSHDTPIPDLGRLSPAELESEHVKAALRAYLTVARRYPEQSGSVFEHERRITALQAIAARTHASSDLTGQDSDALRICWSARRHRSYEFGNERNSALYSAGIFTAEDRATLTKALTLYDRYAPHRPYGWPATAAAALWHLADLAHDRRLQPFRPGFKEPSCRWLADGATRLLQEAKDMRAAARLDDPRRIGRQHERTVKRTMERERAGTRDASSTNTLQFNFRVVRQINHFADLLTIQTTGEPLPGHERDHAQLTNPRQHPPQDGSLARLNRRNGVAKAQWIREDIAPECYLWQPLWASTARTMWRSPTPPKP